MGRNDITYGHYGQAAAEDYLGWQEIMGAQEILGDATAGQLATSSAGVRGSQAFQAAMAQKLARRSPIVQNVHPVKKRRWTVGFGPAQIPPNTTVTVQSQPQCLFRAEKLVNTFDITGLFIQGLFVGQQSQLPTFQNPIAVKTFEGTVLDNEMMLDTCQPALFITFQIQNITAATLTWAASLLGHAVL